MGADGTAAVVWTEPGRRVMVAVRRPAGAFGAAEQIGTGREPAVAVAPDGEVLVVWYHPNDPSFRILAASARPGAAWSVSEVAAVRDPRPVEAAFDRDGRATVAWRDVFDDGSEEIRATLRTASGAWMPSVAVAREEELELGEIAVAANGDAAIAWNARRATGRLTSVALRPPGAAAFGPPQEFPQPPDSSRARPQLAAAANGRFALLWNEDHDDDWNDPVRATLREPGGLFGPTELVTRTRSQVEVAFGPTGELLAACHCALDDGEYALVTFERLAAGLWSPGRFATRMIGHPYAYEDEQRPLLAFDAAGDLHAAWRGLDVETVQPSAQASTRVGGAWTGPRTLSSTRHDVRRVSLAAGPAGEAVAAWIYEESVDAARVQAVLWSPAPDPPPPPPPPLPVQPPSGSQSTQYQADPARTGRLIGTGLAPPLEEAWRREGYVNPYVVLAGGRVFVVERRGEVLHAVGLDLRSGRELWAAPLPGADEAAEVLLAYGAGSVLVVGRYVWALDPASGAVRWRGDRLSQWWPTPPAVTDGRLVFHAGGSGDSLYVVDARTGAHAVRHGAIGSGPAAVGDGLAMLAGACGEASAIDLATGQTRWWHHEFCTGGGHHVTAYDGRWVWSEELPDVRGRVFDETGLVVKRFDGGAPAFDRPLAINVAANVVVARDQRSFAERWRHEHEDELASAPLIADGVVYVASADGDVLALRRDDGAVLWRASVPPLPPWGDVPPGLAAGCGHLLVPAGTTLVAYRAAGAERLDCPAPDAASAPDAPGGGAGAEPGEAPPPAGTPPAADPPPPSPAPARASLRVRRVHSLRRVLAHGLRLQVLAPGGRTVAVVATARIQVARGQRVRRMMIGRARASLREGRAVVRLRVASRSGRALARAGGARVALRAVVTFADGRRRGVAARTVLRGARAR
jgi:outer membrane protein assembly factor BamB